MATAFPIHTCFEAAQESKLIYLAHHNFGVSRLGDSATMLLQRALLVSSVSLAASFSSIPERTLRSPATYTRGNMWS